MATVEDALAAIDAAFAAAPRPPDDALLHEDCYDDGDIAALYGFEHWRDVPDDVVVREYEALSALSPAGYRHFIPAYMSVALRGLDSGDAVVDSTIWSLTLDDWGDERMRAFKRSKWSELDTAQRAAVLSFLRAVGSVNDWRDDDVARALPSWDGSDDGAGDTPAAIAARAAATAAGEETAEAWFDAYARDADGELELMDIRQIAAQRFVVIAMTGTGAFFTATLELGDDGAVVAARHSSVTLPGLDDG